MKANKIEDGKVLMIGDLVVGCIETDIVDEATYKILCKVTDINHYGDVSCEALKPFPDELDWQDGDDFSWIEPIPLTPEILEKNGFKLDKEDGWWWLTPKTGITFWEEGDIELELENKHSSVDIHIKYLHQLQHALRLCGIEKEIEL